MTIAARLESGAEAQPARSAMPLPDPLLRTMELPGAKGRPELSTAELAFRVLAAVRAHPHVSNVLTHISRANWGVVEQSLNVILDSSTTSDSLSPLERNIVDLICAERGDTGRIMKPYFYALLPRLVERDQAERVIHNIEAMFAELERKSRQPPLPAFAPGNYFQSARP